MRTTKPDAAITTAIGRGSTEWNRNMGVIAFIVGCFASFGLHAVFASFIIGWWLEASWLDTSLRIASFFAWAISGYLCGLIVGNAALRHTFVLAGSVAVLITVWIIGDIIQNPASWLTADGIVHTFVLIMPVSGAVLGGYLCERWGGSAKAKLSGLTYDESLRVAWAIMWPTFLANFLFSAVVAPLIQSIANWQQLVLFVVLLTICAFITIVPLIVGRAVSIRYQGFEFRAFLNDGEREITLCRPGGQKLLLFSERLRLAWLFTWRTSALTILILIPVVFSPYRGVILPSSWDTPVPKDFLQHFTMNIPVLITQCIVVAPLVARMMVNKRYRRFRLEIFRSSQDRTSL